MSATAEVSGERSFWADIREWAGGSSDPAVRRRVPRPHPDLRLLPGAGLTWLTVWAALLLPAHVFCWSRPCWALG